MKINILEYGFWMSELEVWGQSSVQIQTFPLPGLIV